MVRADKLRVREVLRRPIHENSDLVCYQVTSGRGKGLMEHAQSNNKKFAKRIVRAFKSYDMVRAALARLDQAVSDNAESKSAAQLHFIDDIRSIVSKTGRI